MQLYQFFILFFFKDGRLCDAMLPAAATSGTENEWPLSENVLRSLSEDVRPLTAATETLDDLCAVAENVGLCLTEPIVPKPDEVTPNEATPDEVTPNEATPDEATPDEATPDQATTEKTAVVIAKARRMLLDVMAVRSAYANGKYYAPDAAGAPYVMRTVEELALTDEWRVRMVVNANTFAAGTVMYEHGGACFLHGFVHCSGRVAVDCSALMDAWPRHRSTVKTYSALTATDDDTPVLLLQHFQAFSCSALLR